MPDNIESLADKFELLIEEIDDVKDAINDNNHPGWVDSEDKLNDLPNAVDTMFIGHAGFYQLAETNSAHIEYPIIVSGMFANWRSDLQTLEYVNDILRIENGGLQNTYISEIPSSSTVQYLGKNSLASTHIGATPIYLPEIVELDNECFNYDDLHEFSTGNKLVRIGDYVFQDMFNLNYTTLSTALKHIGAHAFRSTSLRLKHPAAFASLPEGLEYIGHYAFKRSSMALSALPDSVKYIYDHAFEETACLFTSTLPQSLEYVGEYVFYYNTGTESNPVHHPMAEFTGNCPQNLEYVGERAFKECSNMTITGQISQKLTTVKFEAFKDCSNMTLTGALFNPAVSYDEEKIIKIYNGAFYGCTNITLNGHVRIDESEYPVGKYIPKMYPGAAAFKNCENIEFEGLFPNRYLDNTTIGAIVDYVPFSVFENCKKLRLSQSVLYYKWIERYAFSNCTHIEIANSIKTYDLNAGSLDSRKGIGDHAFYGCTSLVVNDCIEVGSGGISVEAFKDCASLVVGNHIKAKGGIDYSCFRGCSSLVVNDFIEVTGDGGIGPILYDPKTYTVYGAFEDCKSLIVENYIKSVGGIGFNAFKNCTALIVSDVIDCSSENHDIRSDIKRKAFNGCTSLVVENGIVVDGIIGSSAFENISTLKTKEIEVYQQGNDPVVIDKYAFRNTGDFGTLIPDPTRKDVSYTIDKELFDDLSIDIHLRSNAMIEQEAFSLLKIASGRTVTISCSSESTSPELSFGTGCFMGSYYSNPFNASFFHLIFDGNIPVISQNFAQYSSLHSEIIGVGEPETNQSRFEEHKNWYAYCVHGYWVQGDEESVFSEHDWYIWEPWNAIRFSPSTHTIDHEAFNGCAFITDLTLPVNISALGDDVFSRCGIKNLQIDAHLDSCGAFTFADDSGLSTIKFNDIMHCIGDCAFFKSGRSVIWKKPPTVEWKYNDVTDDWTYTMKDPGEYKVVTRLGGSIVLPAKIKNFGHLVFGDTLISEITFSVDVDKYGRPKSGAKKIGIISGGMIISYTGEPISADTSDIDPDTGDIFKGQIDTDISYNQYLQNVTLPETLEEFGGFYNFHALTHFTATCSGTDDSDAHYMKKIGTFYGCKNLETITFEVLTIGAPTNPHLIGCEEFGIIPNVDQKYNQIVGYGYGYNFGGYNAIGRRAADAYYRVYYVHPYMVLRGTKLTSIEFPVTMKRIQPGMFANEEVYPPKGSKFVHDALGNTNLRTVIFNSDCLPDPYVYEWYGENDQHEPVVTRKYVGTFQSYLGSPLRRIELHKVVTIPSYTFANLHSDSQYASITIILGTDDEDDDDTTRLKTIGDFAFQNTQFASNLTSEGRVRSGDNHKGFVIPGSVKSIGEYAFNGASGDIVLDCADATIADNAFQASSGKLYNPHGIAGAPWGGSGTHITVIDDYPETWPWD